MLNDMRLIEVEIHSLCNRKCEWCPNSEIDRTHKTKMSEDTYLKLLKELSEIKFRGVISFSRYNEPMADMDHFAFCTRLAKATLPTVKLVSNTNGDFLTKENLNRIYIDELSIMDYDCIGEAACINKMKKAGITDIKVDGHFIYGKYKKINILYFVDWKKHVELEDRGGFLSKEIKYLDKDTKETKVMKWNNNRTLRIKPCHEPDHFVGIDYDGSVVPCCHIRSDNSNHKIYTIGNINKNRLIDILESYNAVYFRSIMSSSSKSGYYFSPCKYCQKNSGRYTRENPGMEYNTKG